MVLAAAKAGRASKRVHSFVMLLKFQTRSKLESDNKGNSASAGVACVDDVGVAVGVGVGVGAGVGVSVGVGVAVGSGSGAVIVTLSTAVIPPAIAMIGWSPRGNCGTNAVTLKAPLASELAPVEVMV